MAFKSDTRGLGGQKQVMDLMTNHYSALGNVKSSLNTFKKPFVHVSKQKRAGTANPSKRKAAAMMTSEENAKHQNDVWLDKLAKDFDYQETRQTFQRCNNIKSDIGYMTQNPGYKKRVNKLCK